MAMEAEVMTERVEGAHDVDRRDRRNMKLEHLPREHGEGHHRGHDRHAEGAENLDQGVGRRVTVDPVPRLSTVATPPLRARPAVDVVGPLQAFGHDFGFHRHVGTLAYSISRTPPARGPTPAGTGTVEAS